MTGEGKSIAIRPFEIKHLFDFAIRLYRFNFGPMFLAMAMVQLPMMLMTMPFVLSVQNLATEMSDMSQTGDMTEALGTELLSIGIMTVAFLFGIGVYQLLVMPLGNLTCARLAQRGLFGEQLTFAEAFRFAKKRYWATQVAIATFFLPVMILSMLLLLPVWGFQLAGDETGIISSAVLGVTLIMLGLCATSLLWFRFFPALLGIIQASEEPEGEGMFAQGLFYLKRSYSLTQGYYLRCVGLIIVVGFVVGFINRGLTETINMVILIVDLLMQGGSNIGEQFAQYAATGSSQETSLIGMVLAMLVSLVFPAFTLCYQLLMYYDLRCRKEAYDLKLILGLEREAAESARRI